MSKQVILTGLRANNDLHIGNYFGALLPIIDMAKARSEEFDVHLFVPDLHSFTTPIDHSKLQEQILHNLKLFVAAGLPLDNSSVHIYRQSYVPAHSELTWILDCFTGMGELGRMTQFKDKSRAQKRKLLESSPLFQALKEIDDDNAFSKAQKLELKISSRGPFDQLNALAGTLRDAGKAVIASELERLLVLFQRQHTENLEKMIKLYDDLEESSLGAYAEVGLFNYPVLMAADILLYGTSYVPVGDDQTQHLEFARDIAERMNSRFGELFVVPEPVAKQHEFFGQGGAGKSGNHQGLRIKDLADPTKKMSKSEESDRGIIFLGDTPEDAAKKVMSATTDSEGAVHLDYDKQPGVSNLLQILALLQNKSLEEVASEHEGQDRYGDFKAEVAEAVKAFLADFQQRLASVDEAALMQKLQSDEALMNKKAGETLLRVQKAVGLR